MSASRPYLVPDDDEPYDSADSGFELLDYDSESPEPEIIAVHSRAASSTPSSASSSGKQGRVSKASKNGSTKLPDVCIERYKLSKGNVIKPGDTVELEDHSNQQANTMHSGDFLRVKFIIMDMTTDEVRLRGHRLRRTKYLGQIFDWKMTELAMVLRVNEDDLRSPFVAGMEDVDIDEVIGLRECTLTNKPYPLLSFRTGGRMAYPLGMSDEDIRAQIFQGGRLTCRVVNILYLKKNGKPYGGIVRQLYAKEADAVEDANRTPGPGLSRETSISIEDNEEDNCVIVSNNRTSTGKRRASSPDFEMYDTEPTKRRSPHPIKKDRLIFGDVFCGAGGASQGAAQAGYYVAWGLDEWDRALETYRLNHPSAYTFQLNAHNFPPKNISKEQLRVDVLHLSPPCCYFSPAHTHDGPNDQANMEAIYTVGPILSKIKPRVATLEQTFGLATHEEHSKNFFMLLNDIGKAGYDVRYKIQDMSEYGLAQKRKRLIMIAARRGTPLPPFPKRTHGLPGSGLQPYFYIAQALLPITRQGNRLRNDPYHLPMAKLFDQPRPSYDHNSFLKGCITTGGTLGYHPSGKRHFTPRELALLQSFPYTYRFVGGKTEAKKQIGNAFPSVMAEKVYRTIAKTLEAFDNGLIGAEDDLSDLDALLEQKNPRTPQAPRSFFGFGETSGSRNSPYSPSSSSRTPSRTETPLAGTKSAKRAPPSARKERDFPSMKPMGSVLDRIGKSTAGRGSSSMRSRIEASPVPSVEHDIIEISSDEDEEA